MQLEIESRKDIFMYDSATRMDISLRSHTESPNANLWSSETLTISHLSSPASSSMSVSSLKDLTNNLSDVTMRSSLVSFAPRLSHTSYSVVSCPSSTTNTTTARTSSISHCPYTSLSPPSENVTTSAPPVDKRPMLPPCRVCQNKSSGFHYGAYTCEACKGFFRRSLCRNVPYTCLGNTDCNITRGKRTLCASCRYRKCVDVGMSRSGTKTGRYTHERRCQNIIEVKMLEKSRDGLIGKNYVESSTCDTEEEEMQAIINAIDLAQLRLHENLDLFMDDDAVRVKQQRYYDEYMAKRQAVEKKHNLGHPTCSDPNLLAFELSTNMTRGIEGLVSFSKMIPGFNSLSLPDQASLIKYGRIDVWILGHFKCVNRKLQVLTSMCSFHFDELEAVWNKELCDDLASCCESLLPLNLEKQEIGLLRAICLTSTDDVILKDRDKVEEINSTLLNCYRFYCIRRFGNFEKRFGKIISRLIRIREIAEKIRCQTAKMFVDFPQIQQNPALLEAFNN
ncbi:hypothetical protein ACJMK2_020729 [Sinanodonta woodiana]|uniref:Uncharacterized protein n=1 Tax=Sinanodonta woodiana TaxID=1069815 RepID=A0ABD3U1E2_SINWO